MEWLVGGYYLDDKAQNFTKFGFPLGLALSHAMLRGSLREVADSAAQRVAVVSLSALSELAVRSGAKGDAARAAVSAWQQRTPSTRSSCMRPANSPLAFSMWERP